MSVDDEARELFLFATNSSKELDEEIRQFLKVESKYWYSRISPIVDRTITLYRSEYCTPDWNPSPGAWEKLFFMLDEHLRGDRPQEG